MRARSENNGILNANRSLGSGDSPKGATVCWGPIPRVLPWAESFLPFQGAEDGSL